MSEELVNKEELQEEEEIQEEDVLSEDEEIQKEGELPPALQKAIDAKKKDNGDDDEEDDDEDEEDDEEESESAKASTKKESIQVPKTKSAMVKDIYEKINSLKKADLEGLYSNYMTVDLEEDDQKDENKPGKAPKPEDMGGDTPNIDPKTGAKIKKPKAKRAESVEIDVKEDVEALVQGETLSDEFKSKAATIFEAAVHSKVVKELNKRIEDLEKEYQVEMDTQVETFRESMTEKVDGYLNYVVEEWMGENELAVEKGIRSELVEDFMSGLKNLFQEHYIDIPDDKVDLVDDLFTKVEELENKLNEQTAKNIDLTKSISEYKKDDTLDAVCEDLTDTQSEKVKELAKGVEYEDESQYKDKLEMIVENYFPTAQVKSEEEVTNNDNSDEEKTEEVSQLMETYTRAISRSNTN